jgi:hypothetical protein
LNLNFTYYKHALLFRAPPLGSQLFSFRAPELHVAVDRVSAEAWLGSAARCVSICLGVASRPAILLTALTF